MIPRVRVVQTSSPEIYYVEIELVPKVKYLRVMISHDEFHQLERVSHSHWPSEWTIHELLPVNYLYTEPPPATCDEVERLRAENERLREALRQVQWNGDIVSTIFGEETSMCPMCDQVQKRGHAPDCLVGMALEGK